MLDTVSRQTSLKNIFILENYRGQNASEILGRPILIYSFVLKYRKNETTLHISFLPVHKSWIYESVEN